MRNASVELVPLTGGTSYNQAFNFSEAEWLTLLLKGAASLNVTDAKGGGYLQALFPNRPYVFWNVDNF